jgi:hypothetical protein
MGDRATKMPPGSRVRGWAAAIALVASVVGSAAVFLVRRRRHGRVGANYRSEQSPQSGGETVSSTSVEREPAVVDAESGPPETPDETESSKKRERDTDYPAGIWIARLDRVRRFLPPSLYIWVGARLSARFSDEYHWRKSDDTENERGIPPPDERIAWHGVWIVEAFLPSTVAALSSGVERLGWWEAHDRQTFAENVAAGRSGRGGGWAKLPILRRPTSRAMYGPRTLNRDLPAGVEYVTGHVQYLTPSLTVLVVGFRFDEPVSTALKEALSRRYKTYHRMTGRTSSSFMPPQFQRRDAVRELERAQIAVCRRWLAERLPGYFAAGDEESTAPATLLLTTRLVVPFERGEESRYWAPEAGIGFASEQWETGIDGLRYAFRPREDGVAVLAGREPDIFADPEEWRKSGRDATVWSLMFAIDSDLVPLMAFRTADAVLWDAQRRLGRLRDSLARLASSSSKQQLSSVQGQLGTMSSDLTALTTEMLTWPERRSWVLHDIADVKEIDVFPNANRPKVADDRSLRSRLLDFYVEHAREVREFEVGTRGLLVAAAEISGALENIKLQSFVRWVSVLALIVAALALVVSWVK